MMPVSILVNKLAKNYMHKKKVTHLASMPGGNLYSTSLSSSASASNRFLFVGVSTFPVSFRISS